MSETRILCDDCHLPRAYCRCADPKPSTEGDALRADADPDAKLRDHVVCTLSGWGQFTPERADELMGLFARFAAGERRLERERVADWLRDEVAADLGDDGGTYRMIQALAEDVRGRKP